MTKSRGLREHHGRHGTQAYSVWRGMRSRCLNRDNAAFPNYGGRGITICDAWSKFSAFYRDMGDPPAGHSLERIDNDKGYSPDNCKWATRTEQNRNKRGLVQVTIGDETHPLSVWIERFGVVSYATAHQRLVYGWTPEDAIKTPKITDRGSLSKAIRASGLKHSTVMQRIRRGWSVDAALSLTPRKGPRRAAWGTQNGVAFQEPLGAVA